MQDEIYRRMYQVEDRHWWYSAKRTIIRDLLTRFLGGRKRPRVADLGCGCGRLLEELGDACDAVGLDISRTAVDFCARRGVRAAVGALPGAVVFQAGSFDAVILSDILEHVEDDVAAAGAAARLLTPGGVMIVTVPALPALWSGWDEAHGHKRRYTPGTFRAALASSGLKVELLSYYNTLLFPPAAVARLLKRLLKLQDTADLAMPVKWLNAALREIFACERHLLGRVPFPVGLSLVAVLRKRSTSPAVEAS